MDFLTNPRQKWSLNYMMLNVKKRIQKGQTLKSFDDNLPEYPKYNSWKYRTIEMNKQSVFMRKISELKDTLHW